MSSLAKTTRATVILCFPLSKCAAIEWLCATLGVEKHRVVPNDDGTVAHAQLSFGNGMIMVGSAVDSEFGKLMKQPDEIGGFATQSPYVIVSDAGAVYASECLADWSGAERERGADRADDEAVAQVPLDRDERLEPGAVLGHDVVQLEGAERVGHAGDALLAEPAQVKAADDRVDLRDARDLRSPVADAHDSAV